MQRPQLTGADTAGTDGRTDAQTDEQAATTVIPKADLKDTAVVCTRCRHTEPLDRTTSRDHMSVRHACFVCGAEGRTERGEDTVTSSGVVRRVPIDPNDPVGQDYYEIVAGDLLVGFQD